MSNLLSLMSGFGQAAITVVAISFAIVFSAIDIRGLDKAKLMGVSVRISRYTWPALFVVLTWVIGSFAYSVFCVTHPTTVKELVQLIVVLQALGTLLYAGALLLFIRELLGVITPKGKTND